MKKIYAFLALMMCVFATSANPVASQLWIVGNPAGGFAPNKGIECTKVSEGVFTYTLSATSTQWFAFASKLATSSSDWGTLNANRWAPTQGNNTIPQEGENPMTFGKDASWQIPAGDYKFTIDTNNNKLILEGNVEDKIGDLYLRGELTNWNASNAYKFTTTDETIYTLNVPALGAGSVFKVGTSDWGYSFSSENKTMALDKTYTLVNGGEGNDMAFASDVTDITITVDVKAMTITTTGNGAPSDMTIYWDNTVAKWANVYAYIESDEVRSEFEPYPGVQLEAVTGVDNVYSVLIPGQYTKVTFNDGTQNNKTDIYTAQNNYIYSLTDNGSPYSAPADYTDYYVNVVGIFNEWANNGITPAPNGLTTHIVKNVGSTGFKIKVYNPVIPADEWYSTGTELKLGEWTSITGDNDQAMTVPAEAQSGDLQVEFNYTTKQIRVSIPEAPDYTTWSVSFFGDFNEWDPNCGVVPSAEGIATTTVTDVNTAFKIKVYNGHDTYYSTGAEVQMNTWITINGNIDPGMTLPSAYQSGKVTMSFNLVTNEFMVKTSDGIDSIIAGDDAPAVYYNLQGVEVETPSNGLYIVKRGNKVTKEIIR